MVEEGKFREDLYYRLNVVTILLPPLRNRPEDIPILVEHFLKQISSSKRMPSKRLAPEVLRRFLSYRWKGNVRELRHALEQMMVLSDGELLTEIDLPDEIRESVVPSAASRELPTDLTMDELEKLAIVKALDACRGNRTHAAQRLDISVRTLQRKLAQYDLEKRVLPPDSENGAR